MRIYLAARYIFHWLPHVMFFDTWADAANWVFGLDTRRTGGQAP